MRKFYINIIKKNLLRFLPKKIARSIIKKSKINFIFTNLNKLPIQNYKISINENNHENNYRKFLENKLINSYCSGIYLRSILNLIYKKNKRINLLDFGGENIDLFLYLKDDFTKIKYFLVNQEKIVEDINKIVKKNNIKDIICSFDYSKISKYKHDFIFLGSVIHYINDWEKILLRLIHNKPKYIYITGLINYESNDLKFKKNIIGKQINSFPFEYHAYLINNNYLINFFKTQKYDLVFKDENFDSHLHYLNFPIDNNLIKYSDYLFKIA